MARKKLYEKSLREQIADKCIHFNGVMNKICEAGVCYDDFRKELPGENGYRFPCIKDLCGTATCEKRQWPDEAYIQGRLDEIEQSTKRMMLAMELVGRIKQEHKGESWQGVEVCPVCGGKLHLSHAAYNGHVWGRCETENCLAWME